MMRTILALSFVVSLLFCSASFGTTYLKDTPLKECTPEVAMMNTDRDALDREDDTRQYWTATNKKVLDILAKYPNMGNKPVEEYLSKDDNRQVTELLSSTQINSINVLAESRVQRDMLVFMNMIKIIKDARDGKPIPQQAGDPDANYMIYILLLRKDLEGVTDEGAASNTNECNLDLALKTDIDQSFTEFTKTVDSSPDIANLLALRAKYKVQAGQPLDKSTMSKNDAKRATELESSLSTLANRNKNYLVDMENLRHLNKISELRYRSMREDLITVGWLDNAAMDKLDQQRYNNLSPAMKKAWNIWEKIESDMPSQKTKNDMAMAKSAKQNPVEK